MQAFKELAEITRRDEIGEDIYRITVKAPDIAAASRPGQFVMVRAASGFDPLLRRPFSVHQVVEGNLVQILLKVIGKGTRSIADMDEGQQMDILGPLGRGFTVAEGHDHFLVGGGIGIAPLLFLAKRILRKNEPSSLRVLLGARTRDEVEVLAEDFQGLGIAVDSITEDGSFGRQGLVTDLMADLVPERPVMVYSCGPYPMLRAVTNACRNKNWSCQVSLETVMACGLAACLGCSMMRPDMNGYVHVCKDGPVFDAEDVAWL